MLIYNERTNTMIEETEREILMFGLPSFEEEPELELDEKDPDFSHLIFCRQQAD